ncbi:hypothetical protein HPB49_024528 [Dermacentor silvarum]|uniref:Uncharacterized protein n=1 Tax=Dermacentor silvarum TaxID=543639 RepID=A0ACB8DH84_DERSI|nr:hypothetical protein HPB49_024528 [Dermacentor silvarum]
MAGNILFSNLLPSGILKVQAGPQPVVKSILKQDQHQEVKEDVKGILKQEPVSDAAPATPIKPILKPEKPSAESPKSSGSESSSEDEGEEEEDEEEESSSESSSESSTEEGSETEDKKKILLGGQRHLVIAQGSSPQASRKVISNPAVQRKLNASLRRKEEER